jgi:hypothetical protein
MLNPFGPSRTVLSEAKGLRVKSANHSVFAVSHYEKRRFVAALRRTGFKIFAGKQEADCSYY